MVTTLQMLSAEATGTELTMIDSLKITAIGVLIVFAMLAMLIVLIEALHAMLKEKKKAPAPAPCKEAVKEEKRISAGVMAEISDTPETDGEFIAAVSAAITSVIGSGDFTIKSIKKG